jgi:drug/metabolite transporter (DMT)-like permease
VTGPQERSALDYMMLLGAAVIYGAMFSVNKIAAKAGVPPLAYSFWQSFGAGLVLWAVLTLRANGSACRGAILSDISSSARWSAVCRFHF